MRLPRASLIVSALLFVGACGDESTTSEGDGTSSGSGAADFRDGIDPELEAAIAALP